MKGAILQISSIIVIILSSVMLYFFVNQDTSEEKNIILKNDYVYSAKNDLEIAKNSLYALSKIDFSKIKNLNINYEGNDKNKISIKTEKCDKINEKDVCYIYISVYQPLIQLNISQNIFISQ